MRAPTLIARSAEGRRTHELETLHRLGARTAATAEPVAVLSAALTTLVEMGWFACGEAYRVREGEPETVSVGACPFDSIDACPLRPGLLDHARAAIREGAPVRRERWWLIPIGDRGLLAMAASDHARDVSDAFLRSVVELVDSALERASLHDALTRKEADRSRLLQRLLHAQEEERARLSRDLHDQVGQALTGLSLGLERLPAGTERDHLKRLVVGVLSDVRRLAKDLHPAVLAELGFEAAVARHAREVERRTGLRVEATVRVPPLPPELATALYRVVQEALTNVTRHAGAASASVVAIGAGDQIDLVVEDDGRGFDPAGASDGLGLHGMRERIELAGGELRIESGPERGTSVHARVPAPAPND